MSDNKTKSGLIYQIVSILIIAFCLFGFFSVSIVHNNGATIYNKDIMAIEQLNRMNNEVRNIDQNVLMAFIGKDSPEREKVYLANIDISIEKTKVAMTEYEKLSTQLTDMEKRRYNQCRLSLKTYIDLIEKLIEAYNKADYGTAQTIYLQEFKPVKVCTYELLEATVDLSESSAAGDIAHNEGVYTGLCIGFFVFVVVGNFVVLLVAKSNEKKNRSIAEKNHKLKEVNKKVQQTNQKIENIAYTDIITSLPNRYALEEELTKHFQEKKTTPINIAVIDIDNFKEINVMHGYGLGDAYLDEIVARLQLPFKDLLTMYRVTGNEFCLIFNEGVPANSIMQVLEDMRRIIREAVIIDQKVITKTLTASYYHCTPTNIYNADALLCVLDSALQQAKAEGKDRIIIVE